VAAILRKVDHDQRNQRCNARPERVSTLWPRGAAAGPPIPAVK